MHGTCIKIKKIHTPAQHKQYSYRSQASSVSRGWASDCMAAFRFPVEDSFLHGHALTVRCTHSTHDRMHSGCALCRKVMINPYNPSTISFMPRIWYTSCITWKRSRWPKHVAQYTKSLKERKKSCCDWRFVSLHFIYYNETFRMKVIYS